MSGKTWMPRAARISSASDVVGRFAPSAMTRARTLFAFFLLMTHWRAAGVEQLDEGHRKRWVQIFFPPREKLQRGGSTPSPGRGLNARHRPPLAQSRVR